MTSTTPAKPDHQAALQLHFDGGVFRPLPAPGLDHFAFFALPQRLDLDLDALRETFLELSRRFHPDFHATAGAEQRDVSLSRTSQLNNAYKTLREPQKRAEYLIGLVAPDITSNKNAAPPELLEELFDIQEAGEELREARLAADAARLSSAEARVKPLRAQVMESRKRLESDLARRFAAHDAALLANDATARRRELTAIRALLDQTNFLRTVLRNLK